MYYCVMCKRPMYIATLLGICPECAIKITSKIRDKKNEQKKTSNT